MASPSKAPPPTASPATASSALDKRRAAGAAAAGRDSEHGSIGSSNLFDKVEYISSDLTTDEFLNKMKSESEALKQKLQDSKTRRKVLQKRYNEASRLLNIWLDSYRASHDGKEPTAETIHNLAKDIIDGFNTCSLAVGDNTNEIASINKSLKERREVLNQIVVLRKDIKDLTWFETDDVVGAMGDDPILQRDGEFNQKHFLQNLNNDALLSSLIVADSLHSQSVVSDISFSLENQRSEILGVVGGGGGGEDTGFGSPDNGSSNQIERPLTEFEISSRGLVEIEKVISTVKNNIKELKNEYERIKDLYRSIDDERATSRNSLNDWVEVFRKTHSRVPTEVEKHAECQGLILSLQVCQDRLIECFTSMSELKSRFDRAQTRLAALKDRRDTIGEGIAEKKI